MCAGDSIWTLCGFWTAGKLAYYVVRQRRVIKSHDTGIFIGLSGTLQGFRSAEEVANFGDMMQEMGYIVATKYGGSLKVLLLLSDPSPCL
jgi:hypothetical protein